jgi:hypothetical protein
MFPQQKNSKSTKKKKKREKQKTLVRFRKARKEKKMAASSDNVPLMAEGGPMDPQQPFSPIEGYEGVKSGQAMVYEAPSLALTSENADRAAPSAALSMTEAEALEAMDAHAREKCCLRGGITGDLTVLEMREMNAVHVIMESSTEGRATTTATAPHHGGPVDGPHNGPAPRPWDIQAAPTALFRNEKRNVEVPHTSSVADCDHCHRRGTVSCKDCGGQGSQTCQRCHGSGTVTVTHVDHGHHHHGHSSHHHHHHNSSHTHRQSCHSCSGSGRRTCSRCAGRGFVTCPHCEGAGHLRAFIRLDIDWKLYKSERVLDQSALPNNLIRQAQGTTMFQEEDYVLRPVTHLPQAEVNQATNELMQQQKIPPVERLLKQRVQIRCVPVVEVHYTYKGSDRRRFWVYGTDRQIYEDNYPSWCCNIL